VLVLWQFTNGSHEVFHVDADAILAADTAPSLVGDRQPIRQRKINRFSYVETSVEARVICRSSRNYELSWSLHSARHLNSLLNKILWIDQRCFVSNKLGAVAELIFVVLLRISFKLLIGGRIHCVPKLRLSLVQVINRVQIHVLLVPAEHGFPSAYVDVG